ncbi:MAG: IS3 family transposase [Pyrinomonadaceae bacterium]
MKYAFMARERSLYSLQVLCRVLEVSRSGYHAARQRIAKPTKATDEAVRAALRQVHAGSRRTYGRPRLVQALRARDFAIGPKRVRRLMREEGLCGRSKGRAKPRTTDSRHPRPVAANVLARRFTVASAPPAWVSDITYVPTREGWLYLAVVISIQTRQVLGYSLSDRMPDELVAAALLNALARRPTTQGVVFHSDRGSQYASREMRLLLRANGLMPSMSRKGNCWDNAVAESFFATLKNEEITGVYPTKQAAHAGIANYLHGFYNPTRLHSSLGYLSPNEFARKLNGKEAG